jgi:hypothetical protein
MIGEGSAGTHRPCYAQPVSRLLYDNYATVAKDLIAPLLDLLGVSRAAFAGDLDKLLIILVVAQRTAQDKNVVGLRLEDVMSGAVEAYPSLRTNVRSIAESTGIPRETVRRKAADLVAAGWLARQGDDLSYTPEGSRAMAPVREAMLQAAARLHATVAAVTERNR